MTAVPPAPDRFAWRFRLVACCLALVAVAFSQRPGRIVGDTKLDLVVNPAGLLLRSLHLWDPQGGFGQVQNQAYGYLFPMGPFFWVGDLLSIPGWAVQRSWWSLLFVVAFLGVVKLTGVMGLGSPTSRILAAFAYALSPRILSLLGPISIEAWPSALAPWVLVPLVIGARRGSPRSAALWSALAVAAVGGVNAAATFAVIPLGALWLLTRERGPRRRSLMTWWPLFVLIGTAWWLVPLFLLGQYSPPFMNYIETASVTTFPATLFDAIRGTSHWVPYVDATWQAGNAIVSSGFVALDSGVLLLFGIAGLSLARNPHRQFLTISLFVGLVMVTTGHVGALSGWFAGVEQDSLDGALAPLRNVHKFDPVIRLPLVLGLAHVISVMGTRAAESVRVAAASGTRRAGRGERMIHVSLVLSCVVSILGIAHPALSGRLGAWNDFEAIPNYWSRAADWLDANARDTTALLVPGSSFGYYRWGDADDEPMQPLAKSPWAVRNAVPLAPPGNIRMLDAVEGQLASGRPSPGLAGYLRRAGISHLVVRNDLRAGDQPAAVLVHQALDTSRGLRRVATFGPRTGNPPRLKDQRHRTIIDGGWTSRYRAVEVYEIEAAHRAVASSGAPLVVGGPEDLLGLTEAGLLGDEPTQLAVDVASDEATENSVDPARQGLLLTDGLRRRETTFARIHRGKSATLAADDDGRRGAPARDYTLGDGRWETTARIIGAGALTASASRAFADTPGAVLPEALPFAAFDGLLDTAWESGPTAGVRPWVGVEFERSRSIPSVRVVLGGEPGDDRAAARIRIRTDAGLSELTRATPGRPVVIPIPSGTTSSLEVVSGERPERELSIAEVIIPGVDVDRTLDLPAVPAAWGAPDSILLSSTDGWRSPCVDVAGDVRCETGRGGTGEEPGALDRTLHLGAGGTYEISASVAPTSGDALIGLIMRDQFVNVRASSAAVDDPRASAIAAIDGDRGTTWIADKDDSNPSLSVDWLGERTVRSIDLELDSQAAARVATRVELEYPGGRQSVALDSDGFARLKPFRADRVEIRFTKMAKADNLRLDGTEESVGVGVSELRLGGMGLLPITLSDEPIEIGCAFGPTVRVGSDFFPTSVAASPRDLFNGGMLAATPCGHEQVDVSVGATRVVLASAPAFRGVRLTMTSDRQRRPLVEPATLTQESVVRRQVVVPDGVTDGIIAVRENKNPGWKATVPGRGSAARMTVDGWQQAWQLDGPVRRVDLSFAPDRLYRVAVLVGALLLLLLAAAGLLLRRRSGTQAALGPRALPVGVVTVAGLVAVGLVGGWLAVVCGAGATLVGVGLGRRTSSELISWLSGLPLAVAALFYWQRPLGSDAGWAGAMLAPQVLVVVALGLLLSVDLVGENTGRVLKRNAGSSTTR